MKSNQLLHTLKQYKLFGYNYCQEIIVNQQSKFNALLPRNIDELHSYIEHCSLCPLSQNKKLPIGIGDKNSKIYIIGTSKFQHNNNVFKLFTDMLYDISSIDSTQYYLTDILKCDTKKYKLSLEEPKNICIEFLKKQLELSNSKIIVTIGDEFNHLIGKNDDILNISGRIFRYNDKIVIPLIDFEFLYKNPSFKSKMTNDLKKLKQLVGDIYE